MTKDYLGGLMGEFTWDFGCHFFIETNEGNFVWSDPDYNGDNSIIKFTGTVNDYMTDYGANPDMYGRDKGTHLISTYCGDDFIFKE